MSDAHSRFRLGFPRLFSFVNHPKNQFTIAALCAIFLLFFRARWAFEPSWQSDDGCYLAQAIGMAGMDNSSICSNLSQNYFAPGAPLLWLPATLLGKWGADFLGGGSRAAWVTTLGSLENFLFWGMSLGLVLGVTSRSSALRLDARGEKDPSFLSLLFLLNVPVLYYATHRPFMSHAAEWMMASAFLFALSRENLRWATGLAALLTLIRFNDFPAFLLILGKAIDRAPNARLSRTARTLLAALGAVSAYFIFGFKYSYYSVSHLIRDFSWSYIPTFLFGLDFGVVWTAPFWLSALLLGTWFLPRLSWCARGAWAWMFLEALLCVGWGGNGSDFAYRYLIGSYAAALVVWFKILERKREQFLRPFLAIVGLGAFTLTYFLVTYKTISGMGPHSPSHGLHNPDFLWKSVTSLFTQPEVFSVAALQQLPLVTVYLSWFHASDPAFQRYLVSPGVSLITLTLATVLSLLYLLAYSYRAIRRVGSPRS